MIDRTKFWNAARPIFHGPNQPQVDGTNALLDYWERKYPTGDIRWLAYVLATTLWETARTMQPVREAYWMSEEWRKENLRYYPFYGRGDVQLTWEDNYRAMSAIVGRNLVANPDDALIPDVAAVIIFYGMEHGMFGGTGLAYWFNAQKDDPVGARHLVNGVDHAQDIAGIHRQFLAALTPAEALAA
jgi:predicted chitinase